MAPANLALRFFLELATLAALGYGGAHAPVAPALRVALAIGAPLLAALAWGAVVSPRARVRASAPVRLLAERAIFGAGALFAGGRAWWAAGLAATVVLHQLWRAAEQRRTRARVPVF